MSGPISSITLVLVNQGGQNMYLHLAWCFFLFDLWGAGEQLLEQTLQLGRQLPPSVISRCISSVHQRKISHRRVVNIYFSAWMFQKVSLNAFSPKLHYWSDASFLCFPLYCCKAEEIPSVHQSKRSRFPLSPPLYHYYPADLNFRKKHRTVAHGNDGIIQAHLKNRHKEKVLIISVHIENETQTTCRVFLLFSTTIYINTASRLRRNKGRWWKLKRRDILLCISA